MRSPSAYRSGGRQAALLDRSLLAVLTIAVSLVVAPPARADENEKKACSDAYSQTQTLRKEGRLDAAKKRAAACMRDACAEFIRTDCAKWLGEIEASQPTVVLEVRDAEGRETSAVRVSLDGSPWLSESDGKAKAIDPGTHQLRFEIAGAPARDETVQVREGEKNRKISVSFAPRGSGVSQPASLPSRSIAPWIIGGVGVAALAAGAITGGIALSQKSINGEHCNEATRACDAEGRSAASTGRVVGPISTVALVVGGVGVGVSAVWLLARPSAKPVTTVGAGVMVTSGGAGFRMAASF